MEGNSKDQHSLQIPHGVSVAGHLLIGFHDFLNLEESRGDSEGEEQSAGETEREGRTICGRGSEGAERTAGERGQNSLWERQAGETEKAARSVG